MYGRVSEAKELVLNIHEYMQELRKDPTVFVAADGSVLLTLANEYRRPLTYGEIPQTIIDATIAAEDKRFRDHEGVDFTSLMGIIWQGLKTKGKESRGGSTLTMQISYNLYTSTERSLDRKLDDMAMAYVIERKLSKDEILELYLNQMYFGEGAYGVGAAAEVYFGKTDISEITLAEAATLARLVRRPSRENPFVDPDKALKNRNVVLKLMLEQEFIDEAQYKEAKQSELNVSSARPRTVSGERLAPYFIDYLFTEVRKDFPDIDLVAGGYRIETTLDLEMQERAEKAVRDTVERLKNRKVTTGAIVVLGDDGRVLTMVGGSDYQKNQFNAVVQGGRQPGSAFKAIVYSAAFEYGVVTPYDMISNEPLEVEDRPGRTKFIRNSNGEYGGEMTIAQAFVRSINIPAYRVILMTGPANVVNVAKTSFGFKHKLPPYPSLALGSGEVSPMEMAVAFSVFQSGGDRVTPWAIKRILDSDGRTIKRYSPNIKRSVISKKTARILDTLLWDVAHRGTGWRAGRDTVNARGKTGTTNDFKDAWFCGYTDQFIAIAWLGGEVREGDRWVYQSMNRIFGGVEVAPMWSEVIAFAQEKYGEKAKRHTRYISANPVEVDMTDNDSNDDGVNDLPDLDPDVIPPIEPPVPPDDDLVVFIYVQICEDTRDRATIYCPERSKRPYRPGEEPMETCEVHGPPAI